MSPRGVKKTLAEAIADAEMIDAARARSEIRRASLGRPLPGHYPEVGRIQIGRTPVAPARPLYGTTLRCSCGERFGKVANEAPSRGGRTKANARYREHVKVSLTNVLGGV